MKGFLFLGLFMGCEGMREFPVQSGRNSQKLVDLLEMPQIPNLGKVRPG